MRSNDSLGRWWKGNLHSHSFWSDGNHFPEMVADAYRELGYHFACVSDHNVLSRGERWVAVSELDRRPGGREAIEKCRGRFGDDWVEMREGPNGSEVRLKRLEEFRGRVEEAGRFILIEGEEISAGAGGKPVHINAINITEQIPAYNSDDAEAVAEVIERNLAAAQEQANRLGREVLIHLNHPSFRWAITAEELAGMRGERFFEVYNGHPQVNQPGDEAHPGVERMWDIANVIRLTQLGLPPLYGLANDDSHNFHSLEMNRANAGRGWTMVRAAELSAEALIRAIKAGDFYASTGPVLRDVRFNAGSGELSVEIEGDGDASFVTEFVGTLKRVAGSDVASTGGTPVPLETDSPEIGKIFARVEGLRASYRLTGEELYVRAVVTSSRRHERPSYAGMPQRAWTQPVMATDEHG